jgi:hypothetical protein
LPGLASGAQVRLDQRRYEVEDLQVPLRLSRGIHRIRVSKPGLVPYERSFEVDRGTNPALEVQLTRVANRPPPRDAAPVPPPLAHAAKEGSTPDRASKKTPRPRTTAPHPAPMPAPSVVAAEPAREAPGPVHAAGDKQAALLARVVEDPPAGVEPKKTKQTLEEILEAPEEFADQVIIPSGLYRLERYPSFRKDGLIDLSVIQSGLKVQADGSLAPVSGGKMTDLVVAPRLGRRLIGRGVIVRTNGMARRRTNWFNNLAMLTVRVMKNDAAPGEGEWVLGLVKAEFLVDLDFLRIGKGLFKQAFKTVAIASGEEVVGLGNGEEWAERVGLHFTNSIKAIYRRLKNQQSAATWGQFNSQMAKMLNQ